MRALITSVSVVPLLSAAARAFVIPACNDERRLSHLLTERNNDWTSDFEDLAGDSSDSAEFAKLFQQKVAFADLTACRTRQFSLGKDLILDTFVGSMGFDEVTDWEYYYQDLEDPKERQVVNPNPFDKEKPRRTRTSSGSVVRIFRGEFVGQIGGMLGAQGLDRRMMIKEFNGALALALAEAELTSIGKLQSGLLQVDDDDWNKAAGARSVMARVDNGHVSTLLNRLKAAPYLGVLGEVNLAELEDDLAPNDFYRALGVAPPKPGAVWVVYEYAGLVTMQIYARPAAIRRARTPPTRGFFGNPVEPPALPPWKDRASFVVKGIMKKTIQALATLHESNIVHRSIGRNSIILSSKTMDKTEATSPFATNINNLVVKIADFGFSGSYNEATNDEEFRTRARTFGLFFEKGENSVASANFALAEDMHALGFAFLGLLLAALAELPDATAPVPNTDEDSLQRLLGEIFNNDMKELREYVDADDVWSSLVGLLDEDDGAGWKVLETLLLAREKAAKNKDTTQLFTVRGLLNSPFFKFYHKNW